MECIINIADSLKKPKVDRFFNTALNSESTKEILVAEAVKRLKNWNQLGHFESDPTASIVQAYRFFNTKEQFNKLLNKWSEGQLKKATVTITDALGNQTSSIPEEIQQQINQTTSLLQEVIEEAVNELENFVRTKNVHPLVNPKVKDGFFIDFSNVYSLLNNSNTLLSLLEHELDITVTAAAILNIIPRSRELSGLVVPMHTFVRSDLELNDNIMGLKSLWWANIVKAADWKLANNPLYIKQGESWVFNSNLLKPNKDGETPYQRILNTVKEKYENLKKKTAFVESDISPTRKVYIEMLMFLNFDNFIKEKYGEYIKVNPDSANTWGFPNNGKGLKYSLSKIGLVNRTWAPDTAGENNISDYETHLFKLISAIIPFIKADTRKLIGSYLDTLQINAVGGIINAIPNSTTFSFGKHNYNISTWYKKIANNEATIREFFLALEKDYIKDENLYQVIDVIASINNFLYGDGVGIQNKYDLEVNNNPVNGIAIINVESILFNQFRNTGKASYFFGESNTNKNNRLIDTLLITTKVGEDLKDLHSALTAKWISHASTIKEHPLWSPGGGTLDNLYSFLEEYGGVEFSDRAKERYLASNNKLVKEFDEYTINMLKEYFQAPKSVRRDSSEFGEQNPEVSRNNSILTQDEWVDYIIAGKLFNNLDFREIFKAKHNTEPLNLIASTKDYNKNTIPSLAIANLASVFNTVINEARSKTNNYKTSVVLDALEGFTVLLEMVTPKGSKEFSKLSTEDNLSFDILNLFYGNFVNNDKIIVQPWNLADKSKVLAQNVNIARIVESALENKPKGNFFTSEEAKDYLREVQKNYFIKLKNKVLFDYKKLFKVDFTTVEDIEDFLKDKKWNEISSTIQKYNIDNPTNPIEFVEELHYSKYKDGIAFNQLLKTQLNIWTGNKEEFEKFAKIREGIFLENLGKINLNIEDIEIISRGAKLKNLDKIMSKLKEKFGFTDDDFDLTYKTRTVERDGKKVEELVLRRDGFPIIIKASLKRSHNGELSEPLKRYLWTRNLVTMAITNASSKGAIIHPTKSNKPITSGKNITYEEIFKEEEERTVAFYKRMVLLGGSISRFKQGGPDGIPTTITIAATEDPTAPVYNPSGQKDNQKIFDGAIQVSPFLVQQLIDAAPGSNLSRVMKPLGISIQDFHMSFLKCAFFGMNNSTVLNSMESKYSQYEWMKKMHSVQFKNRILSKHVRDSATNIMVDQNTVLDLGNLLENIYVPYKDTYTTISSIGISNEGPHRYSVIYSGFENEKPELVDINNLFDLWNLFGGTLSKKEIDGELIPSEGSIDAVNYIIKLQAILGMYEFKSAMIGMIVPRQAIKNGIANLNAVEKLNASNNEGLTTMSFNTDYLGIQLDAVHGADEASISEVTQVWAALAENNTSPEYYNDVYNTIGKVITESLSEFKELRGEQLKEISDIFIKNIKRNTGINNARVILDAIEQDLIETIPYTDRTVFKQFISEVITKINKEFIRKKITGEGMILNPSYDMIKVYESNEAKIYLTSDILKMYDNMPGDKAKELLDKTKLEFDKAKIKVRYVLENSPLFGNIKLTSVYQINPLETVNVIDKLTNTIIEENVELIEIDDYYNFITKYENNKDVVFEKLNKFSRNLKPSQKTFSYINYNEQIAIDLLNQPVEIIPQTDIAPLSITREELALVTNFLLPIWQTAKQGEEVIGEFDNFVKQYIKYNVQHRNAFNLEATRWRFKFEEVAEKYKNSKDKLNAVLELPYVRDLHNFLLKYNKRYNKLVLNETINVDLKFKLLAKYVEKSVQRYWNLIGDRKIFKGYTEGSKNYFEDIFLLQDGTYDTLDYNVDPSNYYVNTINIFKYSNKDFENISSKLYKSQFNLENVSHADVSESFFNKMFSKTVDRKKYKYYNLLLNNLYDNNRALQVLFGTLRGATEFEESLKDSPELFKKGIYLLDVQGNLVRTTEEIGRYEFIGKPANVITGKNRGNEICRLNTAGEISYTLPKEFKYINLNGEESYAIFETEDGREIAFSKSYNLGKFVQKNKKYFGIVDVWDVPVVQDQLYQSLINDSQDFNLREYLRERRALAQSYGIDRKVTKEIGKVRSDYFGTRAKEMFNSFQLSKQTVDARIPAQAGQSVMAMQTVAYLHDDENSVYVSHWQLWLQGSDFDIDKLYMMAYTFENGVFVGWSPYFSVASKEDLKDSFKLPAPSGLVYIAHEDYVKRNPDVEVPAEQILDLNEVFRNVGKRPTLKDRVNILNYVNSNWNPDVHKYIKANNFAIFNTIKKHNSFTSEEGLNNFKIFKMLQTNRNPKNQLTSYSPISFGDYRSLKTPKDHYLSIYNPYDVYFQQENNYVGKDVVGIAASGIKSYFSLVAYYSNYFSKGDIKSTDNPFFMREYTILDTTRVVKNISGLNLTAKAAEIIKQQLTNALLNNKYEKKEEEGGGIFTAEELLEYVDSIDDVENPALKLSSLLSAATDNAKELLLADINAGVDFSSMHIFLIIMGFNEIEIAKYMTSPEILRIKEHIKDSFLHPKYLFGIEPILRDLNISTLGLTTEENLIKALVKQNDVHNIERINQFISNSPTVTKIFNKLSNSTKEDKKGLNDLIKNSYSIEDFTKQVTEEIIKWYNEQVDKVTNRKVNKTFNEEIRAQRLEEIKQERDTYINNVNTFFKDIKIGYDPNSISENVKTAGEQAKILENFKKIYFHSRELYYLGQLLSINQGIKSTLESSYAVARRIGNLVNSQQLSFFRLLGLAEGAKIKVLEEIIIAYNSLDIWNSLDLTLKQKNLTAINNILGKNYTEEELLSKEVETKGDLNREISNLVFAPIAKDKPYLPKDHIDTILNDVANFEIILKGVDNNRFLTDPLYKKAVTDYYNLIKYTTNILDVLDNLPHFKAMTEAFQTGNIFMEENLLGYQFFTKFLPKLLEVASLGEEITAFSTLSKIRSRGSKASPISLNKDMLDKSADTLFEIILLNWMADFDFNLDLTDFMLNNFDKNQLKIIKNDRTQVALNNVDSDNPGDAFIIDFSKEYDRAKFKYLMEIYLIPKFKQLFSNNAFFKEYTYKKDIGFNMKRSIKWYQNKSRADTTLKVEAGLENISMNADNKYTIPALVRKNSEIIESVPIMDLLTIYDRMLNLKRFGGNRSTMFFSNTKSTPESLNVNLLQYQSQLEEDKEKFINDLIDKVLVNPNDSEDVKEEKKNYREALYLSLFGNTYHGIRYYTIQDPDLESGETEYEFLNLLRKTINNPYFTLVESVDTEAQPTKALIKQKQKPRELAKRLANLNGILEQICK